jgi:hypothetical protein
MFRAISRATGVAIALFAAISLAHGWPLVTQDEQMRDNAAPRAGQSTTPAVSGAPVITVRQPDVSRPNRNPMTFDVQFTAAPGATINPSTFQARYGWLGINITSRLLAHANWTPSGLFAADVDVPTGNHRISISIADTLGRVGTRVVDLQVLR